MTSLPTWQKPIAWTLVVLALPFVAGACAYRKAKWRVWAGRIFITPKEVHRGRR